MANFISDSPVRRQRKGGQEDLSRVIVRQMKIANRSVGHPRIAGRGIGRLWLRRRLIRRLMLILDRPFDDLVQFTTIKPYTTALGATVDLNTLTVGHNQIHFFTDRTPHCIIPRYAKVLIAKTTGRDSIMVCFLHRIYFL
jgi:hypothetical protein